MFDPKTRILIVDDMMTMRKLVAKSCKEMGFSDFLEAADGNLAWDQLATANPPVQLIISDWNMPNCSGLDFLKKVRKDQRFAHLPFILLTAEAEAGQVVEAVQAGVTGYIVKPFNTPTLEQKLAEAYKKVTK